MIDFSSIYSWIFKSFDIADDKEFIQQLRKENVSHIVLLKRSWIFGVYLMWILLFIVLLWIINIYLVYQNFADNTNIANTIVAFLIGSIALLAYSTFTYLFYFKATYCNTSQIVDTLSLEKDLERGNVYFKRFFNQITLNYLIFMVIIGASAYYIIFTENLSQGLFGIINILLLCGQIAFMQYFRKRMIDLAMDFTVVRPGKIHFFNQTSVMRQAQMLEGVKVTTIKSNYAGMLGSFFNYGNVTIFVEGEDSSTMELNFVNNPAQAVENIQKVLSGEKPHDYNSYLGQILHLIGYEYEEEGQMIGVNEHLEEIKEYLKKHEDKIKADYENSSHAIQQEIQEMYELITKFEKIV